MAGSIRYLDSAPAPAPTVPIGPDPFNIAGRLGPLASIQVLQPPALEAHEVGGVPFTLPAGMELYAPDQSTQLGGDQSAAALGGGGVDRQNESASRAPVVQVLAGATPRQLVPPDSTRLQVVIFNNSASAVEIGDATVSYGAGIPIAANGGGIILDQFLATAEYWIVGPAASANLDVRLLVGYP